MTDTLQQQLKAILLALLPEDHTSVGNITLLEQFQLAAQGAGLNAMGDDAFKAARDALVAKGQAVKGRGRSGSTARATDIVRPDFGLQAEPGHPDVPNISPSRKTHISPPGQTAWRPASAELPLP